MRKCATSARALETSTELTHNGLELATRNRLKVDVRVIGSIPSRSECSPIAVTQSRSVEYLDCLEVPGTDFYAAKVLDRVDNIDDWTIGAISDDTGRTNASAGSCIVNNELRI